MDKEPHRGKQQIGGYQRRGMEGGQMAKGSQLYDDGWKLDFRC